MIKEKKRMREVVTKHRYCDDCGEEIVRGLATSVIKCELCNKDLCDSCIGHKEHALSDYGEVYCKRCWDIGEKYRSKIEQLEYKIDELENEWHNKCRSL